MCFFSTFILFAIWSLSIFLLNFIDFDFFIFFYSLLPRDEEAQFFIGRPQLMEFLCWLDYANNLSKECLVPKIVQNLAENIRVDLFEMSIEPMISVLDTNIAAFMLVLMAKIIKHIDAKEFCDGKRHLSLFFYFIFSKRSRSMYFCFIWTELAVWLVGSSIVVDGDDLAANRSGCDENAPAIIQTDCLLNIIIENVQDNLDILLPTLQFIEVKLTKSKFLNWKLKQK